MTLDSKRRQLGLPLLMYSPSWDAEAAYEEEHPKKRKIPSREETTGSLKEKEYDLLIIGGGASGAGVAVDAATRGQYIFQC